MHVHNTFIESLTTCKKDRMGCIVFVLVLHRASGMGIPGMGERRLGHVPPQAFWSGYRPETPGSGKAYRNGR
jgi:hypothetical protein